jgi:tRNA/rRNA methyltransferase
MIMAYEWHMAYYRTQDKKKVFKRKLAGADQRQRLMDHAESVLKRIGFLKEHSGHIRLTLIDMFSRLDLTEREVALLRGILSQIEYSLGEKILEDG